MTARGPGKLCWYCTGKMVHKGKYENTAAYREAIGEPEPEKKQTPVKVKPPTPQELRMKSFSEINAEARARNMSYGEYVAMMETK